MEVSVSLLTMLVGCVTVLFAILSSVSTFIIYRKMNDYKKNRAEHKEVEINYQRQNIENQVYDLNGRMTSNVDSFKDLNHLLITGNDQKMVLKQTVTDDSFFTERGIDFNKYQVSSDLITCLMPFNRKYDKIYVAITDACKRCGYRVIRSDDHFVTGDILNYTLELIITAQIVVVVIDGRNPNVFYELGIAHALGKQVLLLANTSSFQDTPFDIKNNRMVMYKSEKDLDSKLENVIKTISTNK